MLIKNWSLSYEQHRDIPCVAPCSMYSVLLEKGLIKDPFYRLNEHELTGLSDKGCVFTGVFAADEQMLGHEYIELVFYGLDTICSIYVNDIFIAHVDDMHITYAYDVKSFLRQGENEIKLVFASPTQYFKEQNAKHFLWTNEDTIPGAAHLRKALYMSGWDWGPMLPDMGIFRPVELRLYDRNRIEDVFVQQYHRENEVELEIQVAVAQKTPCRIFVRIEDQKTELVNGSGRITIQNPKLWWVRGYGEQNLYELEISLEAEGEVLDVWRKQIGLRTLTVSTAPDKLGHEFCFVLNGVKIFAMGANYIPQENLLPRINYEKTEKLIKSCVDANFNCLRVWGGGYYPEDEFYELCDQYGILVWQDFMSACINVRLTTHFEENFVNEAICNLKRIRHHASLGLLCGNNEMEVSVLVDRVGKSELVRRDYIRLYEHLLPEICETYAPQTFYWPSSPSSGGGFQNPQEDCSGDVHFWTVWHGGVPFTEYRKHTFRFCSEYGFESFPSYKTICSFTEEKDRNIFSRVMESHQKCKEANGKIMMYMAQNYLYPLSFEDLVYCSQLLQADAIKYGVEHFRRNRGICMGSVYWQFNDCWPVASWSSIDYYGRYKALHYAAKKFYAPVAMGLFLERQGLAKDRQVLTVNISNETRAVFHGRVHIGLCRNDFSVIKEWDTDVSVDELTSSDCVAIPLAEEDSYRNYVYADLYDENGTFVMRQTELFTVPKYYEWEKPEFTVTIEMEGRKALINVSSDHFAKGVFVDFTEVDGNLSDNFFDLTNEEVKIVFLETEATVEKLRDCICIKSVYDIGIHGGK